MSREELLGSVIVCLVMFSVLLLLVDSNSPTFKTTEGNIITDSVPVISVESTEDTTPTISITESLEIAPDTIEEPESVETEVIEEVTEPVYDYTEEELDLLARLIYSEGGCERYETQLKIGSVVMNRVDDPAFPNTIREVIYQKNQFSVTKIKSNGVAMIDRPASEDSYQAALEILTYGSVLPPKVQVFYASRVTTGWVASREPYGTFDHTTFAYIYPKGENQ